MQYRRLGKTNLMVSEIGFGGEWLERHPEEESAAVIRHAHALGVNIIDCWMPDPKSRDIIGKGIAGCREEWYIQGHVGSTWQNGQYTRDRDVAKCKAAFEDLLTRLRTDYIDLGMIHYVDRESDWERAMQGPFLDYVLSLKAAGTIRHIGLSTHNPEMAVRAAQTGLVEMILFSVNPAFDLMPPMDDLDTLLQSDYADPALGGIDPARARMYRICEQLDVGLTCMKPFAGGRLFDADRSPFGVAMTPVQCIHYCLTKPAVASVLCGYDSAEQVDAAVAYETAGEAEKDYASLLASAPEHAYAGGECTYCGHCKPCPKDIDIAMVNKLADLARLQPEVPASLRGHYAALAHRADECIACRACESRCPFGVKIADRMAETAALFA